MTPTAKADNMADWIIPVALQSEEQKIVKIQYSWTDA
jgi:hypothetical protein